MQITILNSIYSRIEDKKDMKRIQQCLSYPSIFYYQGQYRKVKKSNLAYFWANKKSNEIYTGHIDRIAAFCKKKKIDLEINNSNNETIEPENDPYLYDYEKDVELIFRNDQKKLISLAVEKQKGVILSPTGTGKTVLAAGIISMFPNANVLFLCHTIGILTQTRTKFINYGFKDISVIGGGKKQKLNRITLAIDKSFAKIDPAEYSDFFDITIIDEVHHLSGRKTQYADIMRYNLSPMKLGFTATMPSEKNQKERLLTIEGFMGPVIGKLTIQEAAEMGILAKPKIKLLSVPSSKNIKDSYKTYKDIYKHAVIRNRKRNMMIIDQVRENLKDDKTSLIMVKEIEHGSEIMKMAKIYDIKIHFVKGDTDGDKREEIRTLLDKKKVKTVIATAVWREGIDIPSLDCIINACGGKSEIMTLQAIGRGLRKAEGKDVATIIDFLDDYSYLSAHTVKRLKIYVESGWL